MIFVSSSLRTECYESFSIPIIYIKITHHYSSGPLYLYSNFIYYRTSILSENLPKIAMVDYHFKKIDDNCEPSVLFTTIGDDFNKLFLSISLYLNRDQTKIAEIDYTFYKGFKPGFYEMYDQTQNFAVHIKVLYADKDYLKGPIQSLGHIKDYLKSISGKYSGLCIITEYNTGVILIPLYKSNEPHDYITLFRAEIFRDETFLGERRYPAFECNNDTNYLDEEVIFITDGDNFDINFYVIDQTLRMKKFELVEPKFDYIYNLKYISQDYNKVFLIRYKIDFIECSNGSKPLLYLSENNITYYATIYKSLNFSSGVEFCGDFPYTPFDSC